LLQFEYYLCIVLVAAEDAAPDLGFAADFIERRQFQHLRVFDVGNAVVRVFIQQGFEDGAGFLAVFAEIVPFLDVVSAFPPAQRRLVEGYMWAIRSKASITSP
jgi:hypothetical protein